MCKVKFHKRLIKIISDIFGDVLSTDGKLLWWGGDVVSYKEKMFERRGEKGSLLIRCSRKGGGS